MLEKTGQNVFHGHSKMKNIFINRIIVLIQANLCSYFTTVRIFVAMKMLSTSYAVIFRTRLVKNK